MLIIIDWRCVGDCYKYSSFRDRKIVNLGSNIGTCGLRKKEVY